MSKRLAYYVNHVVFTFENLLICSNIKKMFYKNVCLLDLNDVNDSLSGGGQARITGISNIEYKMLSVGFHGITFLSSLHLIGWSADNLSKQSRCMSSP